MSPRDLDLDLLRTYLAVVETGSFTAASRKLHLTQPAVSMKVRRLEDLLGTPLLTRSTPPAPTAAGQQLLGYANRLLQIQDELHQALQITPVKQVLRLGVSEHAAVNISALSLAKLKSELADWDLQLEIGQTLALLDRLDRNSLQVVIAHEIPERKVAIELFVSPLKWVGDVDIGINQNTAIPLITMSPGCLYRKVAIEALQAEGQPHQIVAVADSYSALDALIRSGAGVTVLDTRHIPADMPTIANFIHLPSVRTGIYLGDVSASDARLIASALVKQWAALLS